MGNKYVAGHTMMPVYMGSSGTVGDMVYITTGSGVPTLVTGQFAGVLENTASASTYGQVCTEGVYSFTKADGSDVKIEAGASLWGTNKQVGTVQCSTGSVIGLAWEQSSSDSTTVAVLIRGMVSKAL